MLIFDAHQLLELHDTVVLPPLGNPLLLKCGICPLAGVRDGPVNPQYLVTFLLLGWVFLIAPCSEIGLPAVGPPFKLIQLSVSLSLGSRLTLGLHAW